MMLDWLFVLDTKHLDPIMTYRHKEERRKFETAQDCEKHALLVMAEIKDNACFVAPYINGHSRLPYAATASCFPSKDGEYQGGFKISATHEMEWKPFRGELSEGQSISGIQWVADTKRPDQILSSRALCLNGYKWEPCQ